MDGLKIDGNIREQILCECELRLYARTPELNGRHVENLLRVQRPEVQLLNQRFRLDLNIMVVTEELCSFAMERSSSLLRCHAIAGTKEHWFRRVRFTPTTIEVEQPDKNQGHRKDLFPSHIHVTDLST